MNTAHNLRPAVARKLLLDLLLEADYRLFGLLEECYAPQSRDKVIDLQRRIREVLTPPKPPAKRARKHKEKNNG